MNGSSARAALPQEDRSLEHVQGHWLLARLGKRVLRPGGVELTRALLSAVGIVARKPESEG